MKTIFLILLFSLPAVTYGLSGKIQWKVHSQKAGTTVYKADHKHGSGIVPIRATTELDFPIERVLSVISDAEAKPEWVPSLEVSKVIEVIDPLTRIEYARYNSPWPFHDRTFVIKVMAETNPQAKTATIKLHSVDHPKMPRNSKHVRGWTYEGHAIARSLGPNRTFFEVEFLTDFKGNIPKWIINLVQAKWPYKMFKRLNRRLADPKVKTDPKIIKMFKN